MEEQWGQSFRLFSVLSFDLNSFIFASQVLTRSYSSIIFGWWKHRRRSKDLATCKIVQKVSRSSFIIWPTPSIDTRLFSQSPRQPNSWTTTVATTSSERKWSNDVLLSADAFSMGYIFREHWLDSNKYSVDSWKEAKRKITSNWSDTQEDAYSKSLSIKR